MGFNYSKLSGKIKEKYDTQAKFSQAMGVSERTLSLKLNNKISWNQDEIIKACDLLEIPAKKIQAYFFTI